MLELKRLVNYVVVGIEQKLQHFSLMQKQLVAEVCLRVGLKIFSFAHIDNYWVNKILL